MSERYEELMKYYDLGLWDETRIKKAVIRGWLTPEEYKKITGKEYE